MLLKPGKTTFQVPRAARIRRTWCWMSSCNFGTLASFARLPIKEVVVRSRVKTGGILIVIVGATEVVSGGVTTIWARKSIRQCCQLGKNCGHHRWLEFGKGYSQRNREACKWRHRVVEKVRGRERERKGVCVRRVEFNLLCLWDKRPDQGYDFVVLTEGRLSDFPCWLKWASDRRGADTPRSTEWILI